MASLLAVPLVPAAPAAAAANQVPDRPTQLTVQGRACEPGPAESGHHADVRRPRRDADAGQ
ncbi:hypothetical protein O7632_21725 [Solwaraspora sp. WMMD406]|uniref:hypothetical protein n=1 Tax=Solwaraspora sp. WMMD406 TaxID=3016095 RepID=UPI00241782A2|nr:hypothetical protein [Solwaraspora sp. WMMD406]MDG4766695.1 hypothetical protein [Solwaraspora sp. WMMD406]